MDSQVNKQGTSNLEESPSSDGMVENWKRQALSEPALNKILEKNYDEEAFLVESLKERDMADVSELQSKMNHLRAQVVTQLDLALQKNYLKLIADMQKIKDFSLEVEGCKDSIRNAQKSLISLGSLFTSRYETVRDRIPLLKNARDAANLVNKSIKYLQNLKILKTLVSAKYEITDLVKTSLILQDIKDQTAALAGLSFYEKSKGFLNSVKEEVVKKAEKKFADALLQKNQVEISLSIQIFFHLGILAEQLESRANLSLKNSNTAWRQVLIKEYAGEYQGALVVQIKNLLTEDYSNAQQMWLLNQCVKASRDPKSMESYETFLAGKNVLRLFDLFWNKQCQIISQSFQKLLENSSKYPLNTKNVVASYPKIFGFMENFANNFNEYVLSFPDSIISYDFPEIKKKFLSSLSLLSPLFYQGFEQKLATTSAKIIKLLSSSDQQQPFQTLFSQLVSELESGILSEITFQSRDNYSSCALIFAQMSSMIAKECLKLVDAINNQFKAKLNNISINDSFLVIYVLSTYKNQILDPLLNTDNNEMINMDQYDSALSSLILCLRQFTNEIFIPSLSANLSAFLTTYFSSQSQKATFNSKLFAQIQGFFIQFSPYGYGDKTKNFDLTLFAAYNQVFESFLREYSFLLVHAYRKMSVNLDEQTSLGQEIEAMSSIIEKSSSSQNAAGSMKLIINLQKIFYVDAKSASMILEQSQDFSYYLQEGILQFAFALRLQGSSGINMVPPEAAGSFQEFKLRVIAQVKTLVQSYIMNNKQSFASLEEFEFLAKHTGMNSQELDRKQEQLQQQQEQQQQQNE